MTRWLNVLNWLRDSAGKVTCTNQSSITDQSQPSLLTLGQSEAEFTEEDPASNDRQNWTGAFIYKNIKTMFKMVSLFRQLPIIFSKKDHQSQRVRHGFTKFALFISQSIFTCKFLSALVIVFLILPSSVLVPSQYAARHTNVTPGGSGRIQLHLKMLYYVTTNRKGRKPGRRHLWKKEYKLNISFEGKPHSFVDIKTR